MKRILFFLLLFHTSIKPEVITATAMATTLFSTTVTIQTSITKIPKQNSQLKKNTPCCDDCTKTSTIECYAKKKNTPKKTLSSETIKKDGTAPKNQPPEDDPCPPLKERNQKVKDWALKRKFHKIENPPFKNKGMPTYKLTRHNLYVTVDADCHGGSIIRLRK